MADMSEYPYNTFHSVCFSLPSISQNTWSRHQNKTSSVDHLPRLRNQAFFQMSTNILDAYGTELRGSCGDGKEVRCHGPRTRPSTARGNIISFILGKPFYCRIVPAVRSVILAGCPSVFEQVQAVTVMRVWVSEAIPSAFDGGLSLNRYKRHPAQGYFCYRMIILLPFTVGSAKQPGRLLCDCRHTISRSFLKEFGNFTLFTLFYI